MSTSSMADELDLESKSVQRLYPTYPNAYKILEEIGGGGAGATIHKAMCPQPAEVKFGYNQNR